MWWDEICIKHGSLKLLWEEIQFFICVQFFKGEKDDFILVLLSPM